MQGQYLAMKLTRRIGTSQAEVVRLTKRVRMLPCQRAASPSICNDASQLLRVTVVAELATGVLVNMYLEVISNVVPKICARTNSAMMTV